VSRRARPPSAEGARPSPADIFGAALELEPGERAAFVEAATRSEPLLRERVEELLAAHLAADRFLGTPLVPPDPSLWSELRPVTEAPGDRIGPYLLAERLGEGGFGIVYRAEQLEPVRREVALKVIKLGMDTREVIARFEQERRSLALTDHPHIARVLDAGVTETGRPYFVMELVRGEDICSWCDRRRAGLAERLRLLADVCLAVQHAHDRGLVHRDLKPSNVLVTESDGRAMPKVIDFGVAKASHPAGGRSGPWTRLGHALGTPTYMSPEQASPSGAPVDARSDVYTLGVLLYELLTGTTPHSAELLARAAPVEIERILREEPAPRPSQRAREAAPEAGARAAARGTTAAALPGRLRGDLDWIALRALETEPARRYASARALAEDLGRFLARRPVAARPPSRTYRLRRFLGRHRTAALGSAVSAAALLAGATLAALAFLRAQDEARSARARSDFVQELLEGAIPYRDLATRARAAFGQDHAAVAEALHQAAERAREGGDLAPAIELLEQSLDAWRRRHGADHPRVARAQGRLAAALQLSGRLAAAEEHYRASLSMEERLGPAAQPGIEEREGLARILRVRGELGEAARLLEQAVELRQRYFPERRDALAATLESLWDVLRSAGRDEEAVAVYRQRIEVLRAAYPAESLVHAEQLLVFGLSLRSFGQRAEAERCLREGLDLYRRHGFPPGDSYLGSVRALADLVESSGGSALEVDRLLADAEEAARRLHDPRSLELAEVLEHRAKRLSRRGDLLAATEREKEVFEIRAQALGPDFQAEGMVEALTRLATRIAQSGGAPREAYRVAVEAVDLMMLHVPEREPLEWLRTRLRVRLADDPQALESVLGDLESVPARKDDPTRFALLAIVQHGLGQDLFARAYLRHARVLAQRPEWREDANLSALLAEARGLIGGE